MNLPKVISDLIDAQNNFDSIAYTNCFSQTAIVFDEGKTHSGRLDIQQWIDESNKKYKSVMEPLKYIENGNSSILHAECSGTFPGSPIILKFNFEIVDGQIESLKVTD
ncbi:nuclear transport factor 2 family protein [Flavobacterium sp.]|uniref:nuclear transport factor 2 family protein n=1 Tax=Flavobacterium sp. TaxID=239 RepID=UPI0031D5F0FD